MSFYFLILLFLERYFCQIFFSDYNEKKGFSSLSFNLSKDECFFVDKIDKSEKNEKFINSIEFNKVIHYLNLGNFFETGNFIFNKFDLFKYLNDLKDNDLSFSISDIYRIYYRIENKYNLNSTDNFLNEKGKKIYNEEKDNFIEKCGNVLVENYNNGILLISSIKLSFFTQEGKNKFLEEYNKNKQTGNLKETYNSIYNIINKNKIKGNLKISIIQIGGNNNILNNKFFNLNSKCAFINLDKCKETVNKISEDFYQEIQNEFNSNLNLTPIKFKIYIPLSKKIETFNVSSNLTEEIEKSRKIINHFYKKLKYYNLHFENLVNHYPIYSKSSNEIYNNFKNILKSFLELNPENCFFLSSNNICNNIISKIKELDNGKIDLMIKDKLNELKKYKSYIINLKDNMCLNNIFIWDEPHNLIIRVYPNDSEKSYVVKSNKFIIGNIINKENDNFLLELNDGPFHFKFDITSNNNIANVNCIEKKLNSDYNFHIQIQDLDNPYFFKMYE